MKNIVLLITFSVVTIAACSSSPEKVYKEITVEEVRKIVDAEDENIFLLDVRTLGEYYGEFGHLPTATLIPHDKLEERLNELSEYKDKKIIAYCRSGVRSAFASEILSKNGYDAYNMMGGMKLFKSTYPNY